MEQVTITLKAFFILITFLSVYLFYKASNRSGIFLVLVLIWMAIQLFVSSSGFYLNEFTRPPRLILLILPPILLMIILFITTEGRTFIDSLNIRQLTLFHAIRVPVEIVLYYLCLAKAVPQIMTFEGRNFDILSGLSAPVIYYFWFLKNKISRRAAIIWNFICFGLLINILTLALLSARTPFQQFAFNQPNIAIAHFPFIWLPGVIVPLVLFCHIAALRQLIVLKNNLR